MFRVPAIYPTFNEGTQVHAPGVGGPRGSLDNWAMNNKPQMWPYLAGGAIRGMVTGPNIARARPQQPVANQWSDPSTYTTIPGLMKTPTYG